MKKKYILATIIVLALALCFARAQQQTSILLRLVAAGEAMQNETVVYFDSAATVAYNPQFDAPSLGTSGGYLNIVSRFSNIDYQVKGLPALTQGISIPVKLTTGTSGSYQLYCEGLDNMPAGACLFLYDSYTAINWDLRSGAYSCAIADTEQTVRFTLAIITSTLTAPSTTVSPPSCSQSADGMIVAAATGAGPWNYVWKDGNNNIIKTSLNRNNADTLAMLNAGLVRVDVNTTGTCNHSISHFTLNPVHAPVAAFASDTLVHEQQDVYFVNMSSQAASYWWEFGDGMGSADEHPVYAYAAPGTYTVTLAAYGSVCADTARAARVIMVTGATTSSVTGSGNDIVISRDAGGYFVQFNCTGATDIMIRVSDYLGRGQTFICKGGETAEKFYLQTTGLQGRVMLVSAQAGEHKTHRKLIVE